MITYQGGNILEKKIAFNENDKYLFLNNKKKKKYF